MDPWIIALDEKRLYAGCVASRQIIEVDPTTNSVLRNISLNAAPTAISVDAVRGRLWITCMSDSTSFPGHTGSVKVVDLAGLTVIKTIKAGYESNGITVIAHHGYAVVVNSNVSSRGHEPHHTTGCAGRNGYVTFIDLETMELLPGRYEVAVYPTVVAGAPF